MLQIWPFLIYTKIFLMDLNRKLIRKFLNQILNFKPKMDFECISKQHIFH